MPDSSVGPGLPVEDAVIIAAGRGTRMRPATRAVPKEFLPNFDRPLLHSTIEEAIACGARRITIVTSDRSEPFLETYFGPLDESEQGDERLAGLEAILRQVTVQWVRQPAPRGTGNATLYARDAGVNHPFLLMLPDMVFPDRPPGLDLASTVSRLGGNAISVTQVGPAHYGAWGIVEGPRVEPGIQRLEDILEKPGDAYTEPSAAGINGRYLLTPGIYEAIEEVQRSGKTVNGEVNLTDAMVLLARSESFHAVTYEGHVFDSGHPVGYLAASVASALALPGQREAVTEALRPLLDGR